MIDNMSIATYGKMTLEDLIELKIIIKSDNSIENDGRSMYVLNYDSYTNNYIFKIENYNFQFKISKIQAFNIAMKLNIW